MLRVVNVFTIYLIILTSTLSKYPARLRWRRWIVLYIVMRNYNNAPLLCRLIYFFFFKGRLQRSRGWKKNFFIREFLHAQKFSLNQKVILAIEIKLILIFFFPVHEWLDQVFFFFFWNFAIIIKIMIQDLIFHETFFI